MSINILIKRIKDIMRGDSGVDGDAQRLSQIVWILFLKVFDSMEEQLESNSKYIPVIPVGYRWRDWAVHIDKDRKIDEKGELTGDELINYVNNELFPTLRNIGGNSKKHFIVREFMTESINYMKNGILLRKIVNLFIDIDFKNSDERHAFNEIYETLLKGLQSAGKAGEFYTPRAITSFVVEKVNPGIGEKVADFACGTGGFLVEAIVHLQKQISNNTEKKIIEESIYGIEWKHLPYMLATTNLMLHNIEQPNIIHGDALSYNIKKIGRCDKMDVILMNPPFGGNVNQDNLKCFPEDLKSNESADLFIAKIINSLKENGRCGVVVSDGFLCNNDNSKINLRKKLMSECNLHTIIRLPKTVFSPYTDINTNLLFFDKTGITDNIWFYRMDMPEGIKRFNKTNPIKRNDLDSIDKWWDNRREIKDLNDFDSFDTWKSQKYSYKEIEEKDFNLNLCGFLEKKEIILPPHETISKYLKIKNELEKKLENATYSMNMYLLGNKNVTLSNIKDISNEILELDSKFPNDMYKSILQAGIKGELTQQLPSDTPVEYFLKKIKVRKEELINKKIIKRGRDINNIDNKEIPFKIPKGWTWVRLSQLGCIIGGGTPKTNKNEYWDNGEIPWLTPADMKNVNGMYVSSGERNITDSGLKNSSTKLMPRGTIIYSSRAPIGYIAIANNSICTNQGFKSIIPYVMESNEYLYYCLINRTSDIISRASGTTFKEISSKKFGETLIPIPPIEEQKRIVSELKKLLPMYE